MARLAAIHVQREHGSRAALFGPAHHPAERWLAEFGAQQPAFDADDGIANLRDRKDVAHQVLAAFGDRQYAAPQPVDEIDLLDRIDPQIAGEPEPVDAAANVAVAVFEAVEIVLHPLGA